MLDGIKLKHNQLKEVAEKFGIDLLLLFGSQATSKTHKNSDVDLAFLPNRDSVLIDESQLLIDLMEIFKRDDVEIVNLKVASPTLMRAVVRDGTVLYEKEKDIFLKWKLYATKIWMETSWLRSMRDRKLKEWAIARNKSSRPFQSSE